MDICGNELLKIFLYLFFFLSFLGWYAGGKKTPIRYHIFKSSFKKYLNIKYSVAYSHQSYVKRLAHLPNCTSSQSRWPPELRQDLHGKMFS